MDWPGAGRTHSGELRTSRVTVGSATGDEALRPARPGMPARDAGMVTAELAVAIPAAVLVLAMCLAAVSAAIDQIRCVDAARVAARAAARGDDPARVRSLALAAAPDGARVSVARASMVEVTVTARAGGWAGLLPSWTLSARATTPAEDGAVP